MFEVMRLDQAYQQAEREAAVFVKKQQQYQMLDADDEEEEEAVPATTAQKKDVHRKHLRRKREKDVDEDEVCHQWFSFCELRSTSSCVSLLAVGKKCFL